MLRRGFLIQQKPAAKKQLRSNLVKLHINQPAIIPAVEERNDTEHTPATATYFDLLPINVKQILMQWIWYTQPKINWMGDGRDESIRLARMMRLQRIASEILKINTVKIYGGSGDIPVE